MNLTLEQLNGLESDEFVTALGDIFEHSPWVAQGATNMRPFTSVRGLHSAMCRVVGDASERDQLELIAAHPDLAGKAALAGNLTSSSTEEQAGAGLDSLTEEEYERFNNLNDAYKSRFGIPFIIAVKGHDKSSIMAAFVERLENDRDAEMRTALSQIGEIARHRLEALLQHGDSD